MVWIAPKVMWVTELKPLLRTGCFPYSVVIHLPSSYTLLAPLMQLHSVLSLLTGIACLSPLGAYVHTYIRNHLCTFSSALCVLSCLLPPHQHTLLHSAFLDMLLYLPVIPIHPSDPPNRLCSATIGWRWSRCAHLSSPACGVHEWEW